MQDINISPFPILTTLEAIPDVIKRADFAPTPAMKEKSAVLQKALDELCVQSVGAAICGGGPIFTAAPTTKRYKVCCHDCCAAPANAPVMLLGPAS